MKEDFFKYQAQTGPHPLAMEISHAEGSYIYDNSGKAFLDFVAGVSANSLGHGHPTVTNAIKEQLDAYTHVMVYGEYILKPAVELSKLLATHLPAPLETTYLTNSGTEATEGALKLAKKVTGRSEIIAAEKAYHGNTQGAMSVMGFEERKSAFRPLIPGTRYIRFNSEEDLLKITANTAAVILETIQGGAGFVAPENDYLKKVKARCEETGALLILDEIQPGFGRTGRLFGFEHYDIVPDIVIMGKGMGGGMPVGAFTASRAMMDNLKEGPKLGHITTFGGHPVIAAACLATLKELTQTTLIPDTLRKETLFRELLVHPLIKEIRGKGLMLALLFENEEITNHLILRSLDKGLILFWLLFEKKAARITPPLTISEEEIRSGCAIILEVLDEYQGLNVN
ncbi:aminotransferase class III-fold pyridoxal phosphate-dependent enzyme [Leptobacterium flavescens]|uniref:Aminotransferase class III-fold pyridoxal phosphate-dependent enzyme n=1 Tax=Leptobacterium flavescens TaxID=472055 RepID=A0A6P0UUT1_9FLAO|nr:aspartate aminotransferase family protein [Leptobacterium flavescens]NER14166.1 aminotransferase class III-fold pyridoxal phosphate-dependent enzyme [Leptobacterium flavescens]